MIATAHAYGSASSHWTSSLIMLAVVCFLCLVAAWPKIGQTRLCSERPVNPVRYISPAMGRALDVLESGPARSSNSTDADRRCIYWQSADQLMRYGLVELDRGDTAVKLTELGRKCLTSAGRAAFNRGELS